MVSGDKGVPAAFLAFFFFGGTFSIPTFLGALAGLFEEVLVALFEDELFELAAGGTVADDLD